jgi:exonuclease VII small subunit
MSKEQLLAQLKTLVDQTTDTTVKLNLKQEIEDLFPAATTAANQRELTETLSKLKLTQSIKLPKFQKGDNFARYCQRFLEYIEISTISDKNLYMYFLQNINDDQTYSMLKTIELTPEQKASAQAFCPLYKTAIYGEVSIYLKNEVMECKQRNDEAISDFVYRLREKASIAYTDPAILEENCFIAFLRGVKDPQLKRKLNEATSLTNFKEAVKLAKRLEKINEILTEDTEVHSILKESTYRDQRTRDQRTRDRPQNPRSSSNFPNYREGRTTYPSMGHKSRNN